MPPPGTTRERILDTAEVLFAERGYTGVSLREITTAAGVNVAAINYHFYDKEGLYRELIQLRLKQIDQQRLTLLEQAEEGAGGDAIPLPALLAALAAPFFQPPLEVGPHAPRLLGRLLSENQPFLEEVLRDDFHPTLARFGQAVRRHLPALPASDFVWRWSFVVGALHHAVATLPDMGRHSRGLCRPDDREGALRNFVQIAVKALSA